MSDIPQRPLWGPLSASPPLVGPVVDVDAGSPGLTDESGTAEPADVDDAAVDAAPVADGRDLRLWAGCVVVAVVVAAAAAMALAPDDPPAAERQSDASVSVTTEQVDPPIPDPLPTFTPEEVAPPSSSTGTVDVTGVAGDANAEGIARTLSAYFEGINAREYERAFRAYTWEQQQRITYDAWSRGVSTSRDTDVRIAAITTQFDGTVIADVYFTSTQDATFGPNPGETCTQWSLAYTMAPNADPDFPFLIGRVQKIGAGHQAC